MRRLMFAIGILVCSLGAGEPPVWAQSGAATSKARATAAAPVHLNTATPAQLQTLPGVGASTAQRIVDYRQKNGGFKKIEELMNVKGIGEKSFLKLKPFITVSSDKVDRSGGPK